MTTIAQTRAIHSCITRLAARHEATVERVSEETGAPVDAVVEAWGVQVKERRILIDGALWRTADNMAGFDHCECVEVEPGLFDVMTSVPDGRTIASRVSRTEAIKFADDYDHRVFMRGARIAPAVDATFHGAHNNRWGERVCYPDR